jgi:hypothetical protein
MHVTYLRNYIKFYKKQELTIFYQKTYQLKKAPKTILFTFWNKEFKF